MDQPTGGKREAVPYYDPDRFRRSDRSLDRRMGARAGVVHAAAVHVRRLRPAANRRVADHHRFRHDHLRVAHHVVR